MSSTHGSDKYDFELEQFLELDDLNEGDLRTGTIVSISSHMIIVALDYSTRNGIVSSLDLSNLSGRERKALYVDDQVTVKIMSSRDPNTLNVSIYEARVSDDWAQAKKIHENQEIIEVEVTGYNKGGLVAPYGHLRGLIPLSQLFEFDEALSDYDRQHEMAKMRGKKLRVKVIQVDQERRRLVFSERKVHAFDYSDAPLTYGSASHRLREDLYIGSEGVKSIQNKQVENTNDLFAQVRIIEHNLVKGLIVNAKYRLESGVSSNPTNNLYLSSQFSLPVSSKKTLFDITVYGEGMLVEPDWRQILTYRNGGEDKYVVFELTPQEVGKKLIRVEYFYQNHWLTKIEFMVDIVEEE